MVKPANKRPQAVHNLSLNYLSVDNATVNSANKILGALCENIRNFNIPRFGSSMLCHDNHDIIQATITDRITGKYQTPVAGHDKRLHDECLAQWVSYEQRLKDHSIYKSNFTHQERGQLYKARALLFEWFSNFELKLGGPHCDVEFTPGETFVSQKGKTSLYQKLRNKESWTVTHDAMDDFIKLCYNNLSLKRCAKAHFKCLSRAENQNLWWEYSHTRHPGFEVFKHRMQHEVLTIVYGSRGSSVPKNNDKRRFINVEPLGNLVLQRLVAARLKTKLKSLCNDLETGQLAHQIMISDASYSTIDFSNASDSIKFDLVKLLFPKKLLKYLTTYRSPMVLIEQDYYVSEKISSMGNGFTFEVMTCLLLALARSHGDHSARVYGDDVIIKNEYAPSFVSAAACLGFQVNEKKTFINSRFRESCGSFYLDEVGYITCFDFHYIENISDYIVTCNKLRRVVEFANEQNLNISSVLSQAYDSLISIARSSIFGPVSDQTISFDDLKWTQNDKSITAYDDYESLFSHTQRTIESRWVETIKLKRSSDVVIVDVYKDEKFSTLCESLCLKKHEVRLSVLPISEPRQATPCLKVIYDDPFRYAFYLYNGGRAKDIVRNSNRTTYCVVAVLPNGGTIRLRGVKTAQITSISKKK